MTALRCPCECNYGGFCGGCGHAGCSGGINVRRALPPREYRDPVSVNRCGRCGERLHSGQELAEVQGNLIIHQGCMQEGDTLA